MENLDITLISGARPALLRETLASFERGLFRNFKISNAFVNIDRIMGDDRDVASCVDLVENCFPFAQIRVPDSPSFGWAVKNVWQQTGDNLVFHLEDDWLLNGEITPNIIAPLFAEDVGMVQPAIMPRKHVSGEFLMMKKRRRILGFEIRCDEVNAYGTSPRFFRPGLARKFGELLKPQMDPEKQVFKKKNKPLMRAHEPYRCRLLWAKGGAPLITDIGRNWRGERKIEKIDRNGYAKWVVNND